MNAYRLHMSGGPITDGPSLVSTAPLELLLGAVRRALEAGATSVRLEEADGGRLVLAVDRTGSTPGQVDQLTQPTCARCGEPFDHGCNSGLCSLACELEADQ